MLPHEYSTCGGGGGSDSSRGGQNKLPLKLETKSHSGGCVLYEYRTGTNNKRREEKKSFLESFSWWTQKIQLLCEQIIN